jgi:hypothetical protein
MNMMAVKENRRKIRNDLSRRANVCTFLRVSIPVLVGRFEAEIPVVRFNQPYHGNRRVLDLSGRFVVHLVSYAGNCSRGLLYLESS